MRMQLPSLSHSVLVGTIFTAAITYYAAPAAAEEAVAGKVTENLHEISKPHMKDPFPGSASGD